MQCCKLCIVANYSMLCANYAELQISSRADLLNGQLNSALKMKGLFEHSSHTKDLVDLEKKTIFIYTLNLMSLTHYYIHYPPGAQQGFR